MKRRWGLWSVMRFIAFNRESLKQRVYVARCCCCCALALRKTNSLYLLLIPAFAERCVGSAAAATPRLSMMAARTHLEPVPEAGDGAGSQSTGVASQHDASGRTAARIRALREELATLHSVRRAGVPGCVCSAHRSVRVPVVTVTVPMSFHDDVWLRFRCCGV